MQKGHGEIIFHLSKNIRGMHRSLARGDVLVAASAGKFKNLTSCRNSLEFCFYLIGDRQRMCSSTYALFLDTKIFCHFHHIFGLDTFTLFVTRTYIYDNNRARNIIAHSKIIPWLIKYIRLVVSFHINIFRLFSSIQVICIELWHFSLPAFVSI